MPVRSAMETIFLIKQFMERYQKQKKDLHIIFIDLEKAYDKIPRNMMWWALEKKRVPKKYITLIKDMYVNVVTCVKTCDDESDTFLIKIGLHKESALSLYIFTLVMDEINDFESYNVSYIVVFSIVLCIVYRIELFKIHQVILEI
jgi:Reverse transcriptase (RNA-dependent DNA polymerase)